MHTKSPLQETCTVQLEWYLLAEKCPQNRGINQPNCFKGKTALLFRMKGNLNFILIYIARVGTPGQAYNEQQQLSV